jgi:hypothetical protein
VQAEITGVGYGMKLSTKKGDRQKPKHKKYTPEGLKATCNLAPKRPSQLMHRDCKELQNLAVAQEKNCSKELQRNW